MWRININLKCLKDKISEIIFFLWKKLGETTGSLDIVLVMEEDTEKEPKWICLVREQKNFLWWGTMQPPYH